MLDDLRSYLQMASGLTEATTAKARDVVSSLLTHGIMLGARAMPDPQVVGQVQDLAEDLVTTSKANREALTGMIRAEVDRAVARMGFVREDELAALRRHVLRLESELADVRASTDAALADPAASSPAPAGVPADADLTPLASDPTTDPTDVGAETAAEQAAEATVPVKKRKKVLVDPEAGA